jgi:hypothetical protein
MNRTLCLRSLLCLPLLAAPLLAAEELLKPAEHQSLGKKIAKYFEANSKNEGIDKAKEEISKELESLRKKLKDKDPLTSPTDLGKALWQAYGYETAKGVKKGKVDTRSFPAKAYGEKATLSYAIWVPAKYDPRRPYPVIFAIPEKGVKPSDHITEKWVDASLRENALLVAVQMPAELEAWNKVGGAGEQGGYANLLLTFKDVRESYAIDFDRVFLAGRGEGVAAAMHIAGRAPHRFAGVIGRSGDMDAKGPGADNFRSLPTFFAAAGGNATAFSEAAAKLGHTNVTLKADGSEADIWAWMGTHPRTALPGELTLVPGKGEAPEQSYWLAVQRAEYPADTQVTAKVDKATNTITIDATDAIQRVTLYFNDDLIDLDKPVKVIANGVEHSDKIPRNLWVAMGWMYNATNDPGRVYCAKMDYDVKPKPKPK